MRLTTTKIDNVTDCGIVSASAAYGIGFLTSIVYSFCSLFGIGSDMLSEKIEKAKADATSRLSYKAKTIGADGIMDVKYELSFLFVMAYGTAYKYNAEEELPEI